MRRDFDEHSDDALHLSALGRSDDPIGHPLDGGGLDATTVFIFGDLARRNYDWAIFVYVQIQREQKRIERKRYWKRTARTFTWLVLVLAAAALIIIGGWS